MAVQDRGKMAVAFTGMIASGRGYGKKEGGAKIFFALYPDSSTHAFNQQATDGKSQPWTRMRFGKVAFRRMKFRENVAQILPAQTYAGIFYREF